MAWSPSHAHGVPPRFQTLREKFDQVNAVRPRLPSKLNHPPHPPPPSTAIRNNHNIYQNSSTTNINAIWTMRTLGCVNCRQRTSTCSRSVPSVVRMYMNSTSLLLDAISIAVPATPSLMHLVNPSPTGTSASMSMTSYTYPPPLPGHAQPSGPTNGHGHEYDHVNGRYREHDREYDRSEVRLRYVPSPRLMDTINQMDPVDRSNDPSPHESSVNGRSV